MKKPCVQRKVLLLATWFKKVIIAAEQNILLINMAFMEDLEWFKLGFWQAGAGNSAWAGMITLNQEIELAFTT